MIKHTSELLKPEDMLSDTTHEGETIYILAKWKKKKKNFQHNMKGIFTKKRKL